MAKHVLILGCGRSGTSIFGEFFDHLKAYTYLSEPPYEELYELDYSSPIAIKVPRESQIPKPDPGLSFPLSDLQHTIPGPLQIFWQVRHPLDTICSLRVGISKDWGHHPRPLDWQSWLSKPLLAQCAHHWQYLNSVGYEQVAHIAEIAHFESMLHDPLTFAQRIAKIVGVNVENEREAISAWASRVQNTNNEKFIEAQTSKAYSRPDHSVRVERWKENLNDEEISLLIPMVQDTASKFGYSL